MLAHNIRSTHNIGALLRTADGLGVKEVYISGYSPYPETNNDSRLPHVARKNTSQIQKTALGAELSQKWSYQEQPLMIIAELKEAGFKVIGLEQVTGSQPLHDYQPSDKTLLLIGEEVAGLSMELQKACHSFIEIPMFGAKESFNVVEAASMALYHLRFSYLPN